MSNEALNFPPGQSCFARGGAFGLVRMFPWIAMAMQVPRQLGATIPTR